MSRGDVYNLGDEDIAELEAFFGKQAARDAIAANTPARTPTLDTLFGEDMVGPTTAGRRRGSRPDASLANTGTISGLWDDFMSTPLVTGIGDTLGLAGYEMGLNQHPPPPYVKDKFYGHQGPGVGVTGTVPQAPAAPPPPAPGPDRGITLNPPYADPNAYAPSPTGGLPVDMPLVGGGPGEAYEQNIQDQFIKPTDDAQMEEATNFYDHVYKMIGDAIHGPETMLRIGQAFLKPRFGDTWAQATAAASDSAGVMADQINKANVFAANQAEQLSKAAETRVWQAIQLKATQGKTVNLPPELAAGLAVSEDPNMKMMGLIALANPGGLTASAVSLATGLMKIAQTSDEKAKQRAFDKWKVELQESGRNSRALLTPLANMAFLGPEMQEKAMAAIQQAMNMKQDEADEEFLAK